MVCTVSKENIPSLQGQRCSLSTIEALRGEPRTPEEVLFSPEGHSLVPCVGTAIPDVGTLWAAQPAPRHAAEAVQH